MGWKCLYAPYARGYHVRKVLPGNRRALPPEINMHSVKNRFLMRIKNISPDLYWRNWFSITARDLVVVMCCLLWEHTSLKAFWFLAKNLKRVLAKRRLIQAASAWTTIHGELVPVRAGEQAGAQEDGPRALAFRNREDLDRRAHRPARHARHSRQLRRIRDLRRRTLHAPGGTRPPGHRLLPRAPSGAALTAACGCNICPPSATNISTRLRTPSSPPCICWPPRRCRPLLQRRQRHFHACAAPLGCPVALNVDGIERKRKKWNRLAKPGTWSRSGSPDSAPRWW